MDVALARLQKSGRNQIIQMLNSNPVPWNEDFYPRLRATFRDHQMVRESLKGIGLDFCRQFVSAKQSSGSANQGDLVLLQRISNFLAVGSVALAPYQNALNRIKTIAEIRQGVLPVTSPLNLVLLKDEIAHWQESCKLLEERVVSRSYVGGSQGVSFRVAKGVSYRLGSHRGHIESQRGIVPVSDGILTVTNKRVIFAGGTKSFNIPLQKMVGMNVQRNDQILLTATTGNPRLLSVARPENLDILQAVLAFCLGHQQ